MPAAVAQDPILCQVRLHSPLWSNNCGIIPSLAWCLFSFPIELLFAASSFPYPSPAPPPPPLLFLSPPLSLPPPPACPPPPQRWRLDRLAGCCCSCCCCCSPRCRPKPQTLHINPAETVVAAADPLGSILRMSVCCCTCCYRVLNPYTNAFTGTLTMRFCTLEVYTQVPQAVLKNCEHSAVTLCFPCRILKPR